jgi:hypothetical protein
MIVVPADKLAAAVSKYLLPGVIRNLANQQSIKQDSNKKSS